MQRSRSCLGLCSLFVVIIIFAFAMAPQPAPAQVPLRQYDTTLKKMFDAIQTKSYDEFTSNGDERFKNGFTPQMFEDLARKFGPRLQAGYSVTFLTTMKQLDYLVYVWKLSFKDGKDDVLITLFVKDGKVSGFVPR